MGFTLPEQIIQRGRNSNSRNNVYKFPDNLGVHGMLLVFKKYRYLANGASLLESDSITQTDIQDAIMLPLPANIQDTYSIRVQATEQSLGGAALSGFSSRLTGSETFGAGVQDISNTLGSSGASTGAELGNLLTQMSAGNGNVNLNALASGAAFLARRTVDKVGGAKNLDIGTGNTINPRAALYFEGVTLKQHSFDWTLTPANETESETIREIGNTFKRNSLPSYTQFGEVSRALLNYPSMVDMYFFGIDGEYFIKFKTCMIQGVTFNYTPQGLAVMKGGKPAVVAMNVQMTETDIHSAEDYGGSTEYIQAPTE